MYEFHIIHFQFFCLRLRLRLARLTPEKNKQTYCYLQTQTISEVVFVVLIRNITCVGLLYASLGVYDVDLLFCSRNNPRKWPT